MRHIKEYSAFVNEAKNDEDIETIEAVKLEAGMKIETPHGFAKVDKVRPGASTTTVKYNSAGYKGEWTYKNDEELKVKLKDDNNGTSEEDME